MTHFTGRTDAEVLIGLDPRPTPASLQPPGHGQHVVSEDVSKLEVVLVMWPSTRSTGGRHTQVLAGQVPTRTQTSTNKIGSRNKTNISSSKVTIL